MREKSERNTLEFLEDLYCTNNGRLSVDPLVLFKMVLKSRKSGYLSPEVIFMDDTHIKANANINKKAIPAAARTYEKQLMEEINEGRKAH